MKKEIIMKWSTVGILSLSIMFFFLPYRAGHAPLEMFKMVSNLGRIDLIMEGVLQWVVPVAFTLLAVLMVATKFKISKCVMATIFCVIATMLHFASIEIGSGKLGVGIIFNTIIAILGILLPITLIILTKKAEKNVKIITG